MELAPAPDTGPNTFWTGIGRTAGAGRYPRSGGDKSFSLVVESSDVSTCLVAIFLSGWLKR